jgi:hypothetical protein
MNALKVDLVTGEVSLIEVREDDDILQLFTTADVHGRKLREVSKNKFLREWKAVDPDPQSEQIAVVDAYAGTTLERVDVPISPAEYKQSIGSGIGSTL